MMQRLPQRPNAPRIVGQSFLRLVASVGVALCIIAGPTAAGQNVTTGEALAFFEKQDAEYWTMVRSMMGEMAGSYDESTEHFRHGKYVPSVSAQRRRITYAFDASRMSVRFEAGPPSGETQLVYAANSNNRFTIRRQKVTDAFQLIDFKDAKNDGDFFSRYYDVNELQNISAADSFEWLSFSDLIAGRKGMKITSVRYADTPAGRRMLLEYNWPKPEEPTGTQSHCTATLNPDMHCAIEKWERVNNDVIVRGTVDLMAVGDGVPFPRSYTHEIIDRDSNVLAHRTVCQFGQPTFGHNERNALATFTLPAFGLPVPGEASRSSKGMIVGFVGFLLLGIVLAALSHRGKAKVLA